MNRQHITAALALLALLALSACTADTADTAPATVPGVSTPGAPADGTIAFGVYTQRDAATRAGAVGDATTNVMKGLTPDGHSTLETDLYHSGFGVFAYYTGADSYTQASQATFMYNQQVRYDQSKANFEYTPLKYWPNEYGANAQSHDIDRVTFFAYAPYVDIYKSNGQLMPSGTGDGQSQLRNNGDATCGITGLPRMDQLGDPYIDYVVSTDLSKGVDLCWATADNQGRQWGSQGAEVQVKAGMPWLNLTHAASGADRIGFYFRHATAKLNVQVDAPIDASVDGTTGNIVNLDPATRIYVRRISFTGFTLRGSLNLNNIFPAQPNWRAYQATGSLSHDPVTMNDGRVDGREGYLADNGEDNRGLNPLLVQSAVFGTTGETPGVTSESLNLFQPDATLSTDDQRYQHAYVIPTGDPFEVTIEYDVETRNAALVGTLSDGRTPGISIENRATRTVTERLEPGKVYTLRLHLALNSVRFDVDVSTDWNQTEVEVTPNPPKVGDILFDNGAWGSREDYPDAKPVALVFSNQTSARDKALGYKNGYAISLWNANTPTGNASGDTWAKAGSAAASSQVTDMLIPFGSRGNSPAAAIIGDMDGLTHCRTALATYNEYNKGENTTASDDVRKNRFSSDLPLMKAANEYSAQRPQGASEWYLPSLGQMHKLFVNVGGLSENHNWNYNTNYWNNFYGSGNDNTGQLVDNLNAFYTNIGLRMATSKDADPSTYDFDYFFFNPDNAAATRAYYISPLNRGMQYAYYTSTEVAPAQFWYIYLNKSQGVCRSGKTVNPNSWNQVRPVIAF